MVSFPNRLALRSISHLLLGLFGLAFVLFLRLLPLFLLHRLRLLLQPQIDLRLQSLWKVYLSKPKASHILDAGCIEACGTKT